MSFIEAKKIWKEYSSTTVLENLSTRVEEGEFITIVGTSGCGKTTFLKMLLGVETATRGELLLNGQPLPDEPNSDRGIMFQKYSVFPHLTALENVLVATEFSNGRWLGRLYGKHKRAALNEAREALDAVGLNQSFDKYPAELSGGMQQRLALAQSLINRPKILLLDEPFGALDPGIRADMHQLILDLWRQTGITIFMITHDLTEGFYLGTRLWVFDKVRHDPNSPDAFGATITYDIPVGQRNTDTLQKVDPSMPGKKPVPDDKQRARV